jgi:hypothetical protein
MISYDTIVTIFSCAFTKRAAYFGKYNTSYDETSEDAWPTIFGRTHRRSESYNRELYSPHVFKHLEYSSTIFKHAITKCFHNRADNLSPTCGSSENDPLEGCPAYTEVVRLA